MIATSMTTLPQSMQWAQFSLHPPDASDGRGSGGGTAAALLPAAAVMRALHNYDVDIDAFYATMYTWMAKGVVVNAPGVGAAALESVK